MPEEAENGKNHGQRYGGPNAALLFSTGMQEQDPQRNGAKQRYVLNTETHGQKKHTDLDPSKIVPTPPKIRMQCGELEKSQRQIVLRYATRPVQKRNRAGYNGARERWHTAEPALARHGES